MEKLDEILRKITTDSTFNQLNSLDPKAKKKVVEILIKYKVPTSKDIANYLGLIFNKIQDQETVIECARTIGRYNGDAAADIALWLREIVDQTKNKKSVLDVSKILSLNEIVKTVGKYSDNAAAEIANQLGWIAYKTRDKYKTLRGANLINRVGRAATMILDYSKMISVINEGLDEVITDMDGLYAVSLYLNFGDKLGLPKPTKDTMKSYIDTARNRFMEGYGVHKVLNLDQMMMLAVLDKHDTYYIKEIIELVNNAREERRKEYKLENTTRNKLEDIIGSKNVELSSEEMKGYAVISVLGSRDEIKYKEAFSVVSSIVGEKAVNSAKNALYTKHRDVIPKLIKAMKDGDYDTAVSTLKDVKDGYIGKVMNMFDAGGNILPYNSHKMSAVESKNPLDYNRNVQMACVYFPGPVDGGIVEYCNDSNVILVRYDLDGKAAGSAICYKEGNKFLVDSVEGSRDFRDKKIFDKVYEDIRYRAKEYGCKEIILGNSAFNETPNKFIQYISSKYNLKPVQIRLKLDTEGYMETEENGENYVIPL